MTHEQIWKAIEQFAREHGMSSSDKTKHDADKTAAVPCAKRAPRKAKTHKTGMYS